MTVVETMAIVIRNIVLMLPNKNFNNSYRNEGFRRSNREMSIFGWGCEEASIFFGGSLDCVREHVIASAAKQSHLVAVGQAGDCFVASLLAKTLWIVDFTRMTGGLGFFSFIVFWGNY